MFIGVFLVILELVLIGSCLTAEQPGVESVFCIEAGESETRQWHLALAKEGLMGTASTRRTGTCDHVVAVAGTLTDQLTA